MFKAYTCAALISLLQPHPVQGACPSTMVCLLLPSPHWISAAWSRSSFDFIFLMYFWIFVVSSSIVSPMLISPQPPSFHLAYSLSVRDFEWNPPCILRIACLSWYQCHLLLLLDCFYKGRVSCGRQGIRIYDEALVLTIQLVFLDWPYSTYVFGFGWLPCGLYLISICLWYPKVFVAGMNITCVVFW